MFHFGLAVFYLFSSMVLFISLHGVDSVSFFFSFAWGAADFARGFGRGAREPTGRPGPKRATVFAWAEVCFELLQGGST